MANATSTSSGFGSQGSDGFSSAREQSICGPSSRRYQSRSMSPTNAQPVVSSPGPSTMNAVRRMGWRPTGSTPAVVATTSPQAPAQFTTTSAPTGPSVVSRRQPSPSGVAASTLVEVAIWPPARRNPRTNAWWRAPTSMSALSGSTMARWIRSRRSGGKRRMASSTSTSIVGVVADSRPATSIRSTDSSLSSVPTWRTGRRDRSGVSTRSSGVSLRKSRLAAHKARTEDVPRFSSRRAADRPVVWWARLASISRSRTWASGRTSSR